jgi:hypothetical protein
VRLCVLWDLRAGPGNRENAWRRSVLLIHSRVCSSFEQHRRQREIRGASVWLWGYDEYAGAARTSDSHIGRRSFMEETCA